VSSERRRQLSWWKRRLRRPAILGTLRRTTPLSSVWGTDRGTPLDRYYVEHFLDAHRADIHGRVLEVKDDTYTRQFGTGVERADVLDINPANARATVVADLASADAVPTDTFDCFVLTQTLQFIYDIHGAIAHARRILRPGGVLLATLPSVSRIAGGGNGVDYWRFSAGACTRLFGEAFGDGAVAIRAYGNVLASIAFLAGMAHEELSRRELDHADEDFPTIIAVRAVKGAPSR
jgi:SAM-dependent methyltransferase